MVHREDANRLASAREALDTAGFTEEERAEFHALQLLVETNIDEATESERRRYLELTQKLKIGATSMVGDPYGQGPIELQDKIDELIDPATKAAVRSGKKNHPFASYADQLVEEANSKKQKETIDENL